MFKRGFSFAPGYRLEQFLGRGQFGQVWRATAPGGTSAAVKFIDLSGGEGAKEHEGVKRVKQIRHANLMPITAIWLLDQNGQAVEEAPEVGLETIDLGPVLAATPTRNAMDPGATAGSLSPVGERGSFGASATGFDQSPARDDSTQVEASWLAVGMLLGGLSLQHRLRECVKQGLSGIPPRELLSYMEESAKGLDFLNQPRHDLGEARLVAIQHCDVKPANIVLIGSSAVVCDFGLARILSRNQVTATSASGTPAYMAPEAISGRPSRTSDQYSLAVTYYHLRTGSLPVNDGTLWEVLDAHRNGRLDLSLVPEHEQAVLRRATMIDWEQRFESNQDMVDSLREALRLEGETRPVLMPSVTGLTGTATAPTVPADPTVTLMPGMTVADASPTSVSDAQAAETRNGRQWDRTLAAGEKAPQAQSTSDAVSAAPASPWWKQPKWGAAASVPLVAAAWLVIQLVTTGPEGSTANGSKPDEQEIVQAGSKAGLKPAVIAGGDKVIAPTLFSAEEHFAAAQSILGTNYTAAVERFRNALELDPSLRELQPQRVLSGHTDAVGKILISGDGNYLVSVADDSAEFVWSLQDLDAAPIKRSARPGLIEAVALSSEPQQRLAVAGNSGELVVSDLFDPTRPRSWNSESDIISLAWHPQGRYLVAATLQSILLIDSHAPPQDPDKPPVRFDVSMPVNSIAIDPAGQWLLILGDDGIVWRIGWTDVEAIAQVPGAPTPQRFTIGGTQIRVMVPVVSSDRSSDGTQASALVTGGDDGEVTVWSLGEEAKAPSRTVLHSQQVEAIAVTPRGIDGPIASGGGDGVIYVMRNGRTSGNATKLTGHDKLISSLDLSADGRWLVAGSHDGDVTLWDLGDPDAPSPANHRSLDTARPMLRLQYDAGIVHSVRLDPTGQWIIAGFAEGVITLWDLKHAQLLLAVEPSPAAPPPRQWDASPTKPALPPGQAT